MTNSDERLAVSVAEAAKMLGLSQRGIWNLIKSGELPTVRLGHRVLISVAMLRRMFGENI